MLQRTLSLYKDLGNCLPPAATRMKPVTIYTTRTCGYCRRAKALLSEKGVAFEEIVLFMIDELGVTPIRPTYLADLRDSLARFVTYRSWSGSRP